MTDSVKVVLNSQINVGADRRKLLYVSGTTKTYNNPSANGSITSGQVLFSNIALPSLSNSVISRNMRVRYQIQMTCQAGTNTNCGIVNPNLAYNAGGSFVNKTYGALRPFPLSTCTDSCILTINNVPVAVNLRQAMPAILKTIPKEYLEKQATECPSQLDNLPLLITDSNFATQGSDFNCATSSCQPLSESFNSPHSVSRGSFKPIRYDISAGGTTSVIFEVCEPVFVSPCSLFDEQEFLANINTLSLQYNYSLLQDAFVFGGGMQGANDLAPFVYPPGYAVSLVNDSARLEYEQISLDTRVVAIPRVVSYPWAIPQIYGKNVGTLASPLSNTISSLVLQQSDTLRLSFMPSLVYVFAHIPVNTRATYSTAGNYSFADCNFALGSASGAYNPQAYAAGSPTSTIIYDTNQTGVINVQLNNRQGLLQGASIKDLYRVAVRNGYPYSWNEWLMNPVVIFNPVADLGLDLSQSDIYPDMNGNVTLQIQLTYNTWNYVSETITLYGGTFTQPAQSWAQIAGTGPVQTELMVVAVQSGVAEISPDTFITNGGPISAMEVKQALGTASRGETDAYIPSHMTKLTPQGAGISDLFGNVKNVVSSVAKGVGAVQQDPLFQKALRMAQAL